MNEFDQDLITIYKLNHRGEEVWRYEGEVITRTADSICIEARFVSRSSDVQVGSLVFRRGDIMTEWFYGDRWYNIFRVADGVSGALKGWYCNIARPAQISEEVVTQEDLALDVLVTPDGAIDILDVDEFDALDLTEHERQQAEAAVRELRGLAERRAAPFDR